MNKLDEKKILRKEMLLKRRLLSEEEVLSKSEAIFSKLLEIDSFINANSIMSYMNLKNEVNTREIINYKIAQGSLVSVPITYVEAMCKKMRVVQLVKLDNDLKVGNYGILEPISSIDIDPLSIDVILVPAAVYSLSKDRIGYGAGYYDAFMQKLSPNCLKIGLAYDFQIIDSLPVEEHDVKVDIIVTESRIL